MKRKQKHMKDIKHWISQKIILISLILVIVSTLVYCNNTKVVRQFSKNIVLWDNGDTFSMFYIIDDQIDSLFFEYDSGALFYKEELLYGKLEGEKTYYYPSRSVKLIEKYKNDHLDGEAKAYDDEGHLRKQYSYCYPSKECGNWFYYDAFGDTIMIEKYDTGDLIETIILSDTSFLIFKVDFRRREDKLLRSQNSSIEKICIEE